MNVRKISIAKYVLSALLFAAVYSGVSADDQSTESQPIHQNWIDFRFSTHVGVFIYMQEVDGGYYINGYPYDLDWYGLLGEATGIIELSMPATNPAAVDDNSRFAERADSGVLGGYGGVSASYGFGDDLRLNAIVGYGGTGVVSFYGGSGPAVSFGIDYPIVSDKIRLGIGARYLLMYLYHPGSVTVRSEQGPYQAFSIGAVVDWIP